MAATAPPETVPSAAAVGGSSDAPPPRWHTDAMLVLMALIWGINFSVIKYALAFMPALAFNGVRIPVAAAAQMAIARARRLPRVPRQTAVRLVLLGAIGNGLYQVLFITGLSRTRVATAALMIAASPAMIAIVGRIHGSERLTATKWAGVLLQVLGCATVALGAANTGPGGGADSMTGALLILAATLSWAVYAVHLREHTTVVGSLQIGGYTMIGGALVMMLVSAPLLIGVDWLELPVLVWLALAYASLAAMVVAYLFYYRGLRVLGPVRTSMYSNLQPIIAMAVAWIALAERPSRLQAIGGALVVGGLLLARYAADPAEA